MSRPESSKEQQLALARQLSERLPVYQTLLIEGSDHWTGPVILGAIKQLDPYETVWLTGQVSSVSIIEQLAERFSCRQDALAIEAHIEQLSTAKKNKIFFVIDADSIEKEAVRYIVELCRLGNSPPTILALMVVRPSTTAILSLADCSGYFYATLTKDGFSKPAILATTSSKAKIDKRSPPAKATPISNPPQKAANQARPVNYANPHAVTLISGGSTWAKSQIESLTEKLAPTKSLHLNGDINYQKLMQTLAKEFEAKETPRVIYRAITAGFRSKRLLIIIDASQMDEKSFHWLLTLINTANDSKISLVFRERTNTVALFKSIEFKTVNPTLLIEVKKNQNKSTSRLLLAAAIAGPLSVLSAFIAVNFIEKNEATVASKVDNSIASRDSQITQITATEEVSRELKVPTVGAIDERVVEPTVEPVSPTQPSTVKATGYQPSVSTTTEKPFYEQVISLENKEAKSQEQPIFFESEAKSSEIDLAIYEDPINNFDFIKVEEAIEQWRIAWEQQDWLTYKDSYTSNFYIPNITRSHLHWASWRKQRIEKPQWIKISFESLNYLSIANNRVEVELIQHYQSNRYSDFSKKRLTLLLFESGWKIASETTNILPR